jgi:hypothetical protein
MLLPHSIVNFTKSLYQAVCEITAPKGAVTQHIKSIDQFGQSFLIAVGV